MSFYGNAPLEKQGKLSVWDDRKINAGSDWLPEIENAINDCYIALLLISADFLTSDFILRKEVPQLLQRREKDGVQIVPIIVWECPWTEIKWLRQLQARPKDGKPLTLFNSKAKAEAELSAIAKEILNLVNNNNKTIKISNSKTDFTNIIPNLRCQKYISRKQVENDLTNVILKGGVVGIGGMGGIGKSETARQIAEEFLNTKKSPVLWIPATDLSLQEIQNSIIKKIHAIPCDCSVKENSDTIKQALQHTQYLIILDDLGSNAIADFNLCLPPCPPNAVLFTSRYLTIPSLPPGTVRELGLMDIDEAIALFDSIPGFSSFIENEPDAAISLCERCGYHPLALTLAAHRLLRRLNDSSTPIATFVQSIENRLTEFKIDIFTTNLSLKANLDLSYIDLSQDDQKSFRALSAFSSHGFDIRSASIIWNQTEFNARSTLERLQTLSLVTNAPIPGRYRLHDLLYEYAELKACENSEVDDLHIKCANWLIDLKNNTSDIDDPLDIQLSLEFENIKRIIKWAASSGHVDILSTLIFRFGKLFEIFYQSWSEWKDILLRSIELAPHDNKLLAEIHLHLAKVLRHMELFSNDDNLKEAIPNYQKSIALFADIEEWDDVAKNLIGLGDVHKELKDFKSAEQCYHIALDSYQRIKSHEGEVTTLKRIGDIQEEIGDIKSALKTYLFAINIIKSNGLSNSPSLLESVGDIYSNTEEYGLSETYFSESKKIHLDNNALFNAAITLKKLYEVQWKQNKLKLAESNLSLSAELMIKVKCQYCYNSPINDMKLLESLNKDLGGDGTTCLRAYFMYQTLVIPIETVEILRLLGNVHRINKNYTEATIKYLESFIVLIELKVHMGEEYFEEFISSIIQDIIADLSSTIRKTISGFKKNKKINDLRFAIKGLNSDLALNIYDDIINNIMSSN